MDETRTGAPVFIRIDDYNTLLDTIGMIKRNLNDARKMLADLNALKEQESQELQAWDQTLSEIESKATDIDKMMFEPNQEW